MCFETIEKLILATKNKIKIFVQNNVKFRRKGNQIYV